MTFPKIGLQHGGGEFTFCKRNFYSFADNWIVWIIFTTKVAKAATIGWSDTFNLDSLGNNLIIIFRCTLFAKEVCKFFNITVGSIGTLDTTRFTHHFGGKHQHVTFTEKLLCATHIKHNTRVRIVINGEGDTTWNVSFN